MNRKGLLWRGEYTKIKGYCELLHHHIYNSKVLYKHLENQTYKNKNMTHPYAFPPFIRSRLPSLAFRHLSTPSSGHDTHTRILCSFWWPSQYLKNNRCLPRLIQYNDYRGGVQNRSICEWWGDPQGAGFRNVNIPHQDTSFPIKGSPSPQRHSSVRECLICTVPCKPGGTLLLRVGLNDCDVGWLWFCFGSKEDKDALSYRKKGRLKVQWLNILAHSVHMRNHSPLDQIHAAFSLQFALQSLLLFCLLVTFPDFLRLTQHK